MGLPGETVTVKKGQIYINNNKLDAFYGKQFFKRTDENPTGFIDGSSDAMSLNKKIKIPEEQYILAGDVWWRSGFYEEPVSKGNLIGKIVGRIKPKE